MTEAIAKATEKNLVVGSRRAGVGADGPEAFHVHMCGHKCNSPYCETPGVIDCENCGGPPRIQPGYEPWRGRM